MSGSEDRTEQVGPGPIPTEMVIHIAESKFREWVLVTGTIQGALLDVGLGHMGNKLGTVVVDMIRAMDHE